MTGLAKFESEAREWGIPLSVRIALDSVCRPSLKPLESFDDDDHRDLEFREHVAEVLLFNFLGQKADRYIDCGRRGFRLRCEGEEHHEFFSALYCDLRFCLRCAPRRFARLYAKHAGVLDFVRRSPRRSFLLREITLTSANTGVLASEQIKKFNKDVKKTLKLLMKGVEGWGALCVDEVGFNNTNLHVHILFYGPYIEQERLAAIWKKVSGHQVAWISKARVSGARALLHLMKYVSKPPADDPEIIGQLEVAFHGTRRVHALGLFHNFSRGDADAVDSEWQCCPKCGAKLTVVRGLALVSQLRSEGLAFIGSFLPKRKSKEWVN